MSKSLPNNSFFVFVFFWWIASILWGYMVTLLEVIGQRSFRSAILESGSKKEKTIYFIFIFVVFDVFTTYCVPSNTVIFASFVL